MIIETLENLIVGETRPNGSVYKNGEWHRSPIYVVREVERYDYLKQCEEDNESPGDKPEGARYFEVSVD